MGQKPSILVVEDEAIVAEDISSLAREIGLDVYAIAASGAAALAEANKQRPDLALMDINLAGDMDGFETAKILMDDHNCPVVFITAMADETTLLDSEELHPYGWLLKPFSEVEFRTTLLTALNRIQIETQLRESEERFRNLAELAPIGISTMAHDGKFLYVNPKFTEIVGYTLDDTPDRESWLIKAHPEKNIREIVTEVWSQVISRPASENEAFHRVFPVRCKNGVEKLISNRIAANEKHGYVLTYEDITDRVKAEEELRISKKRLQTIFQATPDALAIIDLEGNYVEVNDVFCEFSGYSRNQIIGWSDLDLGLWDNLEDKVRFHKRLESKGSLKSFEADLKLKDGEVRKTLISARKAQLDGAPHALVVIKDIEDWKRDKLALRESQELYKVLTENAGDLIMRLDANFKNHYLSPASKKILGYSGEELVGKSNIEIVHPDDKITWAAGNKAVLDHPEESVTSVFRIKTKSGSYIWLETTNKAILDQETGKVKEIISVARDVTDRKDQQERAIHNERLVAVGELAGGVAHNFNNVLQIVLGNTQLAMTNLELGQMGEAIENLSLILDSSKLASDTVKRLQHFAGSKSPLTDNKAFDLYETVEQAIGMTKVWWKTRPEKQGKVIKVVKRLERGCHVEGRESELFEVVVNLIKNACEAMPEGGVLDINLEQKDGVIELNVSDSGIGVPKDIQKKIFLPFFTTKGSDSVGMGLASSYGIIGNHDGKLLVNSQAGKGATFTIRLQQSHRSFSPKTELENSKLQSNLNILLVDDSVGTLNILTKLLKQMGQSVFQASTGQEALELLDRLDTDLVICDLGLPDMTGWEVGEKIIGKDSLCGSRKTPFIIITGWAGQRDNHSKIVESGVDYLLEKPIDKDQLLTAMNEVIKSSEGNMDFGS